MKVFSKRYKDDLIQDSEKYLEVAESIKVIKDLKW